MKTTDPFDWLGLAMILGLLLMIPLLRKVGHDAELKKIALAGAWAQRFYADERTQGIAARFILLLESQINVPFERYTPKTNFLDDLGMDEMEPVEVLVAIEEEFEISRLPGVDAEKMRTVDDVVRFLAAKLPPARANS